MLERRGLGMGLGGEGRGWRGECMGREERVRKGKIKYE